MQAWVVGALNFSREARNPHCYMKSTTFYRQRKHLCSAGSESHLPSSRPEPSTCSDSTSTASFTDCPPLPGARYCPTAAQHLYESERHPTS